MTLAKSEMLVTVKGPREMKSESQGAPKPLQLKLHRESTFTDIDYLADVANVGRRPIETAASTLRPSSRRTVAA